MYKCIDDKFSKNASAELPHLKTLLTFLGTYRDVFVAGYSYIRLFSCQLKKNQNSLGPKIWNPKFSHSQAPFEMCHFFVSKLKIFWVQKVRRRRHDVCLDMIGLKKKCITLTSARYKFWQGIRHTFLILYKSKCF